MVKFAGVLPNPSPYEGLGENLMKGMTLGLDFLQKQKEYNFDLQKYKDQLEMQKEELQSQIKYRDAQTKYEEALLAGEPMKIKLAESQLALYAAQQAERTAQAGKYQEEARSVKAFNDTMDQLSKTTDPKERAKLQAGLAAYRGRAGGRAGSIEGLSLDDRTKLDGLIKTTNDNILRLQNPPEGETPEQKAEREKDLEKEKAHLKYLDGLRRGTGEGEATEEGPTAQAAPKSAAEAPPPRTAEIAKTRTNVSSLKESVESLIPASEQGHPTALSVKKLFQFIEGVDNPGEKLIKTLQELIKNGSISPQNAAVILFEAQKKGLVSGMADPGKGFDFALEAPPETPGQTMGFFMNPTGTMSESEIAEAERLIKEEGK